MSDIASAVTSVGAVHELAHTLDRSLDRHGGGETGPGPEIEESPPLGLRRMPTRRKQARRCQGIGGNLEAVEWYAEAVTSRFDEGFLAGPRGEEGKRALGRFECPEPGGLFDGEMVSHHAQYIHVFPDVLDVDTHLTPPREREDRTVFRVRTIESE